jgi:hypothetical protein
VTTTARIAELETEIAEVRAAIRQIITGGQAYQGEGRAMTRADLGALRTMEREKVAELRRMQTGGAIRMRGGVYR